MYSSLNNNDIIHSKVLQEHSHTPPSSHSFLVPSPIYIPLEDEAVFYEFFHHQKLFSNDYDHNQYILAHDMSNNLESCMEECNNSNGHVASNDGYDDHCDFKTYVEPKDSRRRRPSNRDRHSKINTVRGPRDRRMRLSIDVAKRFFGLQDLLGFDKASKTVEWLLTESKTAILDLLPDPSCSFMSASNASSSTLECEVLSGITGDQFMVKTGDDQATTKNQAKSCSRSSKKQKDKITKEIRVRARQKARERTIEKLHNYKHGVGQDSTFRSCLN